MTRDLILVSLVLFCLWLAFRNPFAGVLSWTWLALMQPHREVYGYFSSTMRISFLVAALTVLAWLLSKQRKLPPADPTVWAIAIFLIWMTFNSFFAVDSFSTWNMWDRNWKIIALGLLIWATANNKIRIHALIWVAVISISYYGIKGGVLSVIFAGTKHISGPNDTVIGDNNQLALALLMILPLIAYLRTHSANRYIRIALVVSTAAVFLAVVSSYSRGAFLALCALGLIAFTRARNKILYLISAGVLACAVFEFMPQEYYDRLSTLNNADSDLSFEGRVQAWKVAFFYARDHFPLGAGFDGPQTRQVFNSYFPGSDFHAAHSIYFQVLGDNGFIGLAIYLVILTLAFLNCQKIRSATKRTPELTWARDLATTIQLSLVAFCVGGAALSMAYYDLLFIWCGLLPRILALVEQANPQLSKSFAVNSPAFARTRYAGSTAMELKENSIK